MIFMLNGFVVIDQAIPAKEMTDRGVPTAIIPFAIFAPRFLKLVAGLGLALGVFPRWSALLLCAFVLPATFIGHSFWLAAGTPQLQGQLISFCKDMAIRGGLIFIAGTKIQPSLLPRHTTEALGVYAKNYAQIGQHSLAQ